MARWERMKLNVTAKTTYVNRNASLAHRNVVAAYILVMELPFENYSWLLLVTIFVLSTTTNKSQE